MPNEINFVLGHQNAIKPLAPLQELAPIKELVLQEEDLPDPKAKAKAKAPCDADPTWFPSGRTGFAFVILHNCNGPEAAVQVFETRVEAEEARNEFIRESLEGFDTFDDFEEAVARDELDYFELGSCIGFDQLLIEGCTFGGVEAAERRFRFHRKAKGLSVVPSE